MYPYFYIGQISIPAWWVLLICGYAAALIGLILTRPKDFSLSYGKIIFSVAVFIPSSMIGAEILSAIIHYKSFSGLTFQEAVTTSIGAASMGGLSLGIASLWLSSKLARFSFVDMLDFIIPYIALVLAFNRIGCTLAGCCYGIETSLPWGFQFLSDGVYRHPTQVYAMASAFGVFGASRFVYKKLRGYKAFTAFYVVFFYCFLRFFNEFLRAEGPYIAGQVKLLHPFLVLLMAFSLRKLYIIYKSSDAECMSRIRVVIGGSLIRMFLWAVFSILSPIAIIYIANRIWF